VQRHELNKDISPPDHRRSGIPCSSLSPDRHGPRKKPMGKVGYHAYNHSHGLLVSPSATYASTASKMRGLVSSTSLTPGRAVFRPSYNSLPASASSRTAGARTGDNTSADPHVTGNAVSTAETRTRTGPGILHNST